MVEVRRPFATVSATTIAATVSTGSVVSAGLMTALVISSLVLSATLAEASGHGPVFGAATPTLGKGGWAFDQAWMGQRMDGPGRQRRDPAQHDQLRDHGEGADLRVGASATGCGRQNDVGPDDGDDVGEPRLRGAARLAVSDAASRRGSASRVDRLRRRAGAGRRATRRRLDVACRIRLGHERLRISIALLLGGRQPAAERRATRRPARLRRVVLAGVRLPPARMAARVSETGPPVFHRSRGR